MGKPKGSREKYTSKGIHGSSMKTRDTSAPDYAGKRLLNQIKAWKKGKNVVLTVANPNKNETNKPFIKISGKQAWGSHKKKLSVQ